MEKVKKSIPYWRNKADALLTPIIKAESPYCLLCGAKTQVAHHFVHKSKSTALRYVLSNLVALCNACHIKLHWNESYWAAKIIQIRGLKWFTELEKEKNKIVKADWIFYKSAYEYLKTYYET